MTRNMGKSLLGARKIRVKYAGDRALNGRLLSVRLRHRMRLMSRTRRPSRPETISVAALIQAYSYGVFPMAESRDDPDIMWIDPEWRGLLPLDGFHLPRRLARTIRTTSHTVTVDKAFEKV